jgi:hypothetical protein
MVRWLCSWAAGRDIKAGLMMNAAAFRSVPFKELLFYLDSKKMCQFLDKA